MKRLFKQIVFDPIEIKAFRFLFVVIFIWILTQVYLKFYSSVNDSIFNLVSYNEEISTILDSTYINNLIEDEQKSDTIKKVEKSSLSNFKNKPTYSNVHFLFDPNTISFDSLLLLGFDRYTARNLIKYRLKSGRIRYSEDLLKIYGMDQDLFDDVQPYIRVKSDSLYNRTEFISYDTTIQNNKRNNHSNKDTVAKVSFKVPYTDSKFYKNLKIELNSADTNDLKKLHGIGSFYAHEIIKSRNQLGGFYSIDQIKNIWCIRDSLFNQIKPKLILDTTLLRKININSCDVKDLAKHPYIGWKQAKFIINYRNNHGPFWSSKDIKLGIIEEKELEKILPYIEFE